MTKRTGTCLLIAGLIVLLVGFVRQARVPDQLPMPEHRGFMEGEIDMYEVRRQSNEWMAGNRHIISEKLAAEQWMEIGACLAIAGGVIRAGQKRGWFARDTIVG